MLLAATASQALVGLVVGIPSLALGYWAYRKSQRVDAIAAQAGIATSQTTSIGQVVDGLNTIITNLQNDNGVLRGEIGRLRESVEEVRERIAAVETGSTDLRAKNRELERENGVLHAENEALKVEVEKLKARVIELERTSGP